MHLQTVGVDVVRDGNDLFLGDNGAIKSVLQRDNFGWSARYMRKNVCLREGRLVCNILMGIITNDDVILDILQSQVVL